MSESSDILEMIKLLTGEVKHLRRIVHFQGAQIQALRVYAVSQIADLNRQDREAAFEHVSKMIRALYDEQILKLETKFPALAADIDIRPSLSSKDQDLWYLASEDFPKSGESENGENGDQKV
jgi:hypothetical protein